MLKFKIKEVYDRNLKRLSPPAQNVLIQHQQKDQRTGRERQRSRIRKNRRMMKIINLARKNMAAGKIIKVGK